jgi:hypothetical protein
MMRFFFFYPLSISIPPSDLMSLLVFNLKFMFSLLVTISLDKFQSPTPPPSAKTPKTVSDKKRFFEHVMEDQQKPTPKSGK